MQLANTRQKVLFRDLKGKCRSKGLGLQVWAHVQRASWGQENGIVEGSMEVFSGYNGRAATKMKTVIVEILGDNNKGMIFLVRFFFLFLYQFFGKSKGFQLMELGF